MILSHAPYTHTHTTAISVSYLKKKLKWYPNSIFLYSDALDSKYVIGVLFASVQASFLIHLYFFFFFLKQVLTKSLNCLG